MTDYRRSIRLEIVVEVRRVVVLRNRRDKQHLELEEHGVNWMGHTETDRVLGSIGDELVIEVV